MWLTDTSLTTSHYYFMASERRVYSRRSHTLMSELPLMLCSTQRPLLRSVCDPSLEFTNTSKCINSAEEERLASQLILRNAIAEEITGACHGWFLGLSVCTPLWKMLLFSDLSWDIIWCRGGVGGRCISVRNKWPADMIQRVLQRLWAPFGTCRRLSAYRRANGQPIGHGGFRLNLNEGVGVLPLLHDRQGVVGPLELIWPRGPS